ncbi:methyltransferase domain-containing protein [Jiella endophytica]|uniref:Methyltransferase domain-containing protein n=1 Tax=Jiella endophytica TaxID=2558362 RepID=A0A4Y8RCU6_9HYPH|nr:methyltransferase domain-containing protein [Jiella endophytica]
MAPRISLERVQNRYNSQREIWDPEDYWHFHLHRSYHRILNENKNIFEGGATLNAGGGQHTYFDNDSHIITCDVAPRSLRHTPRSVCADVHYLPFGPSVFDAIYMVGSVLNYCSATEVIGELYKTLKPGGYIAFDFEQTNAFEHMGTNIQRKDQFLLQTEIHGSAESIWLYNRDLILAILKAFNLLILKIYYIHVATSLLYGLTKSNYLTRLACNLEFFSERIPLIQRRSSSVFIIAQKVAF